MAVKVANSAHIAGTAKNNNRKKKTAIRVSVIVISLLAKNSALSSLAKYSALYLIKDYKDKLEFSELSCFKNISLQFQILSRIRS